MLQCGYNNKHVKGLCNLSAIAAIADPGKMKLKQDTAEDLEFRGARIMLCDQAPVCNLPSTRRVAAAAVLATNGKHYVVTLSAFSLC